MEARESVYFGPFLERKISFIALSSNSQPLFIYLLLEALCSPKICCYCLHIKESVVINLT